MGFLFIKATSKNVIPAEAGIHKLLKLLNSHFRGSDELGIIRGSLNSLKIVKRLIYKIPPDLPLPALGREHIPKGGITPLW